MCVKTCSNNRTADLGPPPYRGGPVWPFWDGGVPPDSGAPQLEQKQKKLEHDPEKHPGPGRPGMDFYREFCVLCRFFGFFYTTCDAHSARGAFVF